MIKAKYGTHWTEISVNILQVKWRNVDQGIAPRPEDCVKHSAATVRFIKFQILLRNEVIRHLHCFRNDNPVMKSLPCADLLSQPTSTASPSASDRPAQRLLPNVGHELAEGATAAPRNPLPSATHISPIIMQFPPRLLHYLTMRTTIKSNGGLRC